MKAVKEVFSEYFSLDDSLFGKKEQWKMWCYIGAYFILSLNIVPIDVILAVITLLFIISSTKLCFFQYVFYLLFENVMVFSFGITCNLVFHLVLLVKIVLFSPKCLNYAFHHKLFSISFAWLLYTLFYGAFSFLLGHGFTGFNIFFKSVFFIYSLSYLYSNESVAAFWKTIFQLLSISVLITVLYGYRYDTGLERWVEGLDEEFGSQLYGTLGTTRTGLFTIVGFIYAVYFVKNNILKVGLAILYVALTFMTMSLTATALLVMAVAILFWQKGYFKIRKIALFSIVLFVAISFSYPFLSELSIVKPVILRIENATQAVLDGDLNKATSHREELSEVYWENFQRNSLPTQLFGEGKTAALGAVSSVNLNSHNTYLDMLFYYGIIGVIFILYCSVRKLSYYRRYNCFYPILTLKLLFIVGGASVSVFSISYYVFLMLI